MPEINNYSFSNAVFNIQEGAVINDQITSATITISPLPGYTATASDFSLDPSFSNTYVQSVTFTQSGANVICAITFLPTVTMPSANVTIPLCVVGSANPIEVIIDGALDVDVGPNVTGNNSVKYYNSGLQGESELLFTEAYTPASGYYLMATGIQVTEGNQSNYNIVQTPTYDTDNRLVGVSYDVNYIYPPQDVQGDLLELKVVAREIYNPLPKISGYIFDTSALGNPEETRTLTVLGIPDTPFSATLNDGTTTTTIINNEIIGSKGTYNHDITFPALIKGSPSVTYTIEITGSYVADINLPNPFTVDQLNEVQIIVGKVNNVPVSVSGWPSTDPRTTISALLRNPYGNLSESNGIWLIQLDYNLSPSTGAGTFDVLKQIEISDFTNTEEIETNANGNQTNVTSLTVDDTTGILAGDKIALLDTLAPYESTVSSVDSGTTLTISPAITVSDNQQINFYRDNGNKIEIFNSDVTSVNDYTINVKCDIVITNSGDAGITFDLDLSNIITHNPATAFGMTGTHATNTAACADTSYTNTVYVTNDEFEVGKTVYTNYVYNPGNVLTTPFVGNSGFYAVDINPKIAIKIDSNGVIIDAIHLCV